MYYILYAFLYLISLLPFPVLYLISDVAYLLIYYVIGYRKDVVLSNLSIAFPEKTITEKTAIAKQFYKNFTDNFVETIKLFSISKKQLQKRFTWDFATVNDFYATGKNVQLHLAHFFNWEYANLSLSLNSAFPAFVIYMPLVNKAVNKIFYNLRSRFGGKLIAATAYRKEFSPYSKERFCIVFVADQSAGNVNKAYWLPFFGRLSPFVTGPEKSARLNNAIALYASYKKIKRGYYSIEVNMIADEPRNLPEGELTKRMIQYIEENIRENAANYLWTHRRWKHTFDAAKHTALS